MALRRKCWPDKHHGATTLNSHSSSFQSRTGLVQQLSQAEVVAALVIPSLGSVALEYVQQLRHCEAAYLKKAG